MTTAKLIQEFFPVSALVIPVLKGLHWPDGTGSGNTCGHTVPKFSCHVGILEMRKYKLYPSRH